MIGRTIVFLAAAALASGAEEAPYRFSPNVAIRAGRMRVAWREALADGSRRDRAAEWDGSAWRVAGPALAAPPAKNGPAGAESVAWLGTRACFVEGVAGADARLRVEGSTIVPRGVPLGPLAADGSVAAWIARVEDDRQRLLSAEWTDAGWRSLETPPANLPSEPVLVTDGAKAYLAWSDRDRDGVRRVAVAVLVPGARAWTLLAPPTRASSSSPRCAASGDGVCCVWSEAGGRVGVACLESGRWRGLKAP